MDSQTIASLVNFGAAGAVIAVVIIFLRHLKERDKQWQDFFTAINAANVSETMRICSSLDALVKTANATYDRLVLHDERLPAVEARIVAEVKDERKSHASH